jgi:hypothetical protein
MSITFCWLAFLAFCGTFFVGLVTIALYSPVLAVAIAAMLAYVLIVSVYEQ